MTEARKAVLLRAFDVVEIKPGLADRRANCAACQADREHQHWIARRIPKGIWDHMNKAHP